MVSFPEVRLADRSKQLLELCAPRNSLRGYICGRLAMPVKAVGTCVAVMAIPAVAVRTLAFIGHQFVKNDQNAHEHLIEEGREWLLEAAVGVQVVAIGAFAAAVLAGVGLCAYNAATACKNYLADEVQGLRNEQDRLAQLEQGAIAHRKA